MTSERFSGRGGRREQGVVAENLGVDCPVGEKNSRDSTVPGSVLAFVPGFLSAKAVFFSGVDEGTRGARRCLSEDGLRTRTVTEDESCAIARDGDDAQCM